MVTDNKDDYIWGYYEDKNRLFEKTNITLMARLKYIVDAQTREYKMKNFNRNEVEINKYIEGRLL